MVDLKALIKSTFEGVCVCVCVPHEVTFVLSLSNCRSITITGNRQSTSQFEIVAAVVARLSNMGDDENPKPSVFEWLDSDYVAKIVRKYTNSSLVEIKSFKIGPLTAKGENYFSALYTLNVQYSDKIGDGDSVVHEKSYVLKTRLENELMLQLEEDFDVFVREAQYYTVISDESQKLYGADRPLFCPR